MRTPVYDLKPGDLVDLEGDPYADEDGEGCWAEYGQVEEVERETDDCILVTFTNYAPCGFPVEHTLEVVTP